MYKGHFLCYNGNIDIVSDILSNWLIKSKKMTNEEKLISLKEASKLTPFSSDYLGLLVRKGKLGGEKVGGKWMTSKRAIEVYLQKTAESSYVHQQTLNVKIPAEEIKKARVNFKWALVLLAVIVLAGLMLWKIMDDKQNENVRNKYRISEDKNGNLTIYADHPEEVKSVNVMSKE